MAPRLPRTFVSRTRLWPILDRAVGGAVTVICAPAGYGKTALLTDWAGSRAVPDVAWVSLDRDDNDERRFWSAILSGFAHCATVPADSPLRALVPPGAGARADFLAELIDALATLPAPVRLVLDDFHEIVRRELLDALATVIRHHPAGLRLVLATRFEPQLRLARLHPQGELTRIGADELRFTVEETACLLRANGVDLDDDRVRHLVARTAGWAGALGWVAASLRGVEDADTFLREFDGDDLGVVRFLTDEVLSTLPESTFDLLRRISVCDAVTATLAVRLSDCADAGAVLDDLERHTSLVIRIGGEGGTYRLQPLLRSCLRADLERSQPARAVALHGAAGRWFAGEKRIGEALAHAVAGQARAELLDLLHAHAVRLLLAADGSAVREALAFLGAETVDADPYLSLVSALDHTQRGELEAAAGELGRHGAAGGHDALRRLTLRHHALATGRRLPADAGPAGDRTSVLETWTKLDLAWASLHRGARRHAATRAKEALRLSRREGLDYLTLQSQRALATAKGLDGDHPAMRMACDAAIAVACRHGWRLSPGLADCHLMLAYDNLLRLDTAAAVRGLARVGGTLAPASPSLLGPLKCFLDGVAQFDTGDRAAGSEGMRVARHRLADLELPGELAAALAVVEHQAALSLGEALHAGEVLTWAQERIHAGAELSLLQARNRLETGEAEEAEEALGEVWDGARPPLLPTTPVDACLVETALAQRAGRRTKALRALDRALSLARPCELVRPFALAGPLVGHLLIDHSGGFGSLDGFAQTVRARIVRHDAQVPQDDLTDRERVVLQRLPSPRSLDEIASELTVSINTVKTHVRAIYGKLGVNNRRSAVAVARQHGLA